MGSSADPVGALAATVSLFFAASCIAELVATGQWELGFYLALHIQAAVLFLIRRRPKRDSAHHWLVWVAVLASVLWPWLFRPGAAEPGAFPQGAFVAAMFLCLTASATLGNLYGVLPAVRGVRTTGLYRVVRHPIYASYCVLDVALYACAPGSWNAGVLITGWALILFRIALEERALSLEPEYVAYQNAVRYRLVPWIY